ncbi:MAG: LysM peptidoglycan-binding domain-containing protein [Akkermansiaceae bacterium]|nr:LysM peptidoglycan-binding domain-containing protein [Akkermansiaceae bacterium]
MMKLTLPVVILSAAFTSSVVFAKPTEKAPNPRSSKPAGGTSASGAYKVKAGDNLYKISSRVGTTPNKLAQANGLKLNSVIQIGQVLKIPKASAPAATKQKVASAPPKKANVVAKVTKKAPKPEPSPSSSEDEAPKTVANIKKEAVQETPTKKAEITPAAESEPVAKTTPAPEKQVAATQEAAPAAPATASKEAATVAEAPAPAKKIKPVTVDSEITYGEFASKHNTDTERLNSLNGLDLTTATVLAKGSELYVPNQL